MAELEVLLRRLVERAATPLERATAMPPEFYRSTALFERELDAIFAKEWLCPGRAADIATPGDYLTFSINDQSVFTVRGHDGAIHSFSNVCLHRMMRLLDGRGNCARIVCPYHAWTYDIDGRLLGAPHMKRTPNFDPREHRLPQIRTEVWEGWIYVTLNETAAPVADALAPLHAVVAPYAMAEYVPIAMEDYVWSTNWKILAENFMEGYHLPVAHRRTVGAWFPAEETEFPAAPSEAFTYQTFTKDEAAKYGRAHPANTRLEGRWRYTSVMPTIYPTHMYVLAPDHLWYLSLRPRTVGAVQVRFGVALAPEVFGSLEDRDAATRDLLAFFDKVNDEDRHVVEAIHANTAAPLARPGRLSWLERELHDFHGYLARRLASRTSDVADAKTRRVAQVS
jgi:phenylpropionate dioxygenase-like ring-hydroxylating dioxygenase large terminal subunit